MMNDNEVFESVAWESEDLPPPSAAPRQPTASSSGAGYRVPDADGDPTELKWEGYLIPLVSDPIKELEGTKDMYVSYRVTSKVGTCPLVGLVGIVANSDERPIFHRSPNRKL